MSGEGLCQQEALDRITLLRSPRIGPVSYLQLLARFGDAGAALAALPDLARAGGQAYQSAPKREVEREIEAVRKAGARYLFHDQKQYPALLAAVATAPPILSFRGDLSLAAAPCVALVGARNASSAAMVLARAMAGELAQNGYTIVSGLARGIDAAAHQGAMPRTIGVIASGIDIAYPAQNAGLHEEIAQQGLLIAEQPAGTDPRGRHFPSRNRIIAGLSMGTLVIEAAPKSGTLITARLAGEAGREVMAIPGSPLDLRAQGSNQLIRDGAQLVQSTAEVIEALEGFTGLAERHSRLAEEASGFESAATATQAGHAAPHEPDSNLRARLTELLSAAPSHIDDLIRQSGASPGAVQMALLEIELAGGLERHDSGAVSRLQA